MRIRHAGIINPDCYWILKEKPSLSEQNPGQKKEKTKQDKMEISLHCKTQEKYKTQYLLMKAIFTKP